MDPGEQLPAASPPTPRDMALARWSHDQAVVHCQAKQAVRAKWGEHAEVCGGGIGGWRIQTPDGVFRVTSREMKRLRLDLPARAHKAAAVEARGLMAMYARQAAAAGDSRRERALTAVLDEATRTQGLWFRRADRFVVQRARARVNAPRGSRRAHTPHGRTARTHRATTAGRDDGEDDPDEDPAALWVAWATPERLPEAGREEYRRMAAQAIDKAGRVPWCILLDTFGPDERPVGLLAVVTDEEHAENGLNVAAQVALRRGRRVRYYTPTDRPGGAS